MKKNLLDGLTFHNNTPFSKRHTNCQVGHEKHDLLTKRIQLKGQPIVHEYPSFHPLAEMEFDLTYFDYVKYDAAANYCPGRDDIQRSIGLNGVWEGYETTLMQAILKEKTGVVLDFGCNIGWFSAIAERMGAEVYAFDTDGEMCDVARANCPNSVVTQAWIDQDSPQIPSVPIRFIKADVEGMEAQVIRVCGWPIGQLKVDYLLLEISPCFNKSYPSLVAELAAAGYTPYQIPDKKFPHKAEWEQDPIGTLKRRCRLPEGSYLKEYVAGLFQENFVFVKQ